MLKFTDPKVAYWIFEFVKLPAESVKFPLPPILFPASSVRLPPVISRFPPESMVIFADAALPEGKLTV